MTLQSRPIDSGDLNAYVDGQLSSEQRARIEERVGKDPDLRREIDELQATSRLLATLREYTPHRSFALGPEHIKTVPTTTPGKFVQILPLVRSLSVAATLVFMVVAGSLFFDINGDPTNDAAERFHAQNEIMSNSGVTESDDEALERAEDAPDQAAPAAADESSQPASEDNGSSMTSRGDAAADDAPMEDLTTLQESETGSTTTNPVASSDEDRSTWVWTNIAAGGVAIALVGLWVILAQAGRQSSAR